MAIALDSVQQLTRYFPEEGKTMSDSSPRVSIIMRSCNDSDVIRGTLQMVRAQTYTNYEL